MLHILYDLYIRSLAFDYLNKLAIFFFKRTHSITNYIKSDKYKRRLQRMKTQSKYENRGKSGVTHVNLTQSIKK